jgi:DNA-binding NtrC family response regulator
MMEAQMTHVRRIGQSRPLMGETDELNYSFAECTGYFRSGTPANDADKCSATILVVEDDELLRVTVSDILRNSRFDVREAATVGDATRLLASMPDIDILFGDIRLPDGSGFELAKWCRQVRPRVRIILTSGWYKRPPAAGEFLVLLKPYRFATLLELLKQSSPRRGARSRLIEVK